MFLLVLQCCVDLVCCFRVYRSVWKETPNFHQNALVQAANFHQAALQTSSGPGGRQRKFARNFLETSPVLRGTPRVISRPTSAVSGRHASFYRLHTNLTDSVNMLICLLDRKLPKTKICLLGRNLSNRVYWVTESFGVCDTILETTRWRYRGPNLRKLGTCFCSRSLTGETPLCPCASLKSSGETSSSGPLCFPPSIRTFIMSTSF